jgi:hypothetical protein
MPTTAPSPMSESFFKPVAVGVSIALLIGMLTIYNDVQANSSHRISSEQKDLLLLDMSRSLVRMEQDLKYLRSDVDDLKVGQKELSVRLLEDRGKVLQSNR